MGTISTLMKVASKIGSFPKLQTLTAKLAPAALALDAARHLLGNEEGSEGADKSSKEQKSSQKPESITKTIFSGAVNAVKSSAHSVTLGGTGSVGQHFSNAWARRNNNDESTIGGVDPEKLIPSSKSSASGRKSNSSMNGCCDVIQKSFATLNDNIMAGFSSLRNIVSGSSGGIVKSETSGFRGLSLVMRIGNEQIANEIDGLHTATVTSLDEVNDSLETIISILTKTQYDQNDKARLNGPEGQNSGNGPGGMASRSVISSIVGAVIGGITGIAGIGALKSMLSGKPVDASVSAASTVGTGAEVAAAGAGAAGSKSGGIRGWRGGGLKSASGFMKYAKGIPLLGDVAQGVSYGMESGSIGKGIAAGLGSLGGRALGAAVGTVAAPGVGTVIGETAGSFVGAAGAANAYDELTTKKEDTPTKPAPVPSSSGKGAPGEVSSVMTAGAGFNVLQLADGTIQKRTGDRNWRNNNPGNLEFGAIAKKFGALSSDGRFAIFPSYTAGREAAKELLFSSSKYAGLNIGQAISKYAPPSENNTAKYIRDVTKALGVSADTPMMALDPGQQDSMLAAMQSVEGSKVGKIEVLGKSGTMIASSKVSTPKSASPYSAMPSLASSGNDSVKPLGGVNNTGKTLMDISAKTAINAAGSGSKRSGTQNVTLNNNTVASNKSDSARGTFNSNEMLPIDPQDIRSLFS